MKPGTKNRTASNRAAAVGQWEEVPTNLLKEAVRRVRSHNARKRQTVEASILEYGILNPITINDSDVVVDGHLRLAIAAKLGFRTVPVIRVSHMSDAELRAYALAANKMPSVANYDLSLLRLELEEIHASVPKLDLTVTGFSIGEIDRLVGHHQAGLYDDLDEDDGERIDPASPRARPGDLFKLGDHRLICGDSLDVQTYERLMQSEAAHCCFTDPPYNVKINGHVSSSGKHREFAVASGELTSTEFQTFLENALLNVQANLRDGAIAFVCMDHAHLDTLLIAGSAVFDERLNICVWDKGRGGMGSLYRSQHELIAVFKNGSAPHLNNISLGKHGRDRTNVWSFPGMIGAGRSKKKARELHPTVKPVALMGEALIDVTAPGQIVLDPFGGSGSTLIAAERTGRRARLIELDPVYVDRIIDRWERLTGQTAQLIEGPSETAPAIDRRAGE